MDEPTSSLSLEETEQLFEIIRRLRGEGVAIIYISHRLDELQEIGDRVTIMRDGRHVHTGDMATTDLAAMIRHMVGRELTDMYPKVAVPFGEERLRVEGLTAHGGRVRDVSFSIRAGEIAALTAEGRLSGSILLALPFVFAGILHYLSPGYLSPLFTEPLGHILLGVGILLMAIGVMVIHKLLSIDL